MLASAHLTKAVKFSVGQEVDQLCFAVADQDGIAVFFGVLTDLTNARGRADQDAAASKSAKELRPYAAHDSFKLGITSSGRSAQINEQTECRTLHPIEHPKQRLVGTIDVFEFFELIAGSCHSQDTQHGVAISDQVLVAKDLHKHRVIIAGNQGQRSARTESQNTGTQADTLATVEADLRNPMIDRAKDATSRDDTKDTM